MRNWVKTIQPYLSTIARIASRLSATGWAEKNAGNFSIKIGDLLLTKIAGSLMKQIACKPLPHLCLVQPEKTVSIIRFSRPVQNRQENWHLISSGRKPCQNSAQKISPYFTPTPWILSGSHTFIPHREHCSWLSPYLTIPSKTPLLCFPF